MCGIAGEVNFGSGPRPQDTRLMVDGLSHRGPDDSGLWVSPEKTCVLGQARLSIIDLSPLGHQPMIDELTGNAVTFNGEIYNFEELRSACIALGDRFKSKSDTEVILALYRRHGVDFLSHLRGMFAIAIWDGAKQQLVLARDRVGKKPLVYAETSKGIVFASELFPLLSHPAVSAETDMDALELYFQIQAVPAPHTIYRQIKKLPPAHFAVVGRNGMKISPYWTISYLDTKQVSEDDALEELEEKLLEAVKLRMISDVPIGALLSGGVDSSVVVALMAKLADEPVRTFSIGFQEETFNELPYAATAAQINGTIHLPKIVSGNLDGVLPKIARHYGEPFADSSAVPSFKVSEVARESVTVVLNGDGGDELLGGYPRYQIPGYSNALGSVFGTALGARPLVNLMPLFSGATSFPARAARKALTRLVYPEVGSLLLFNGHWNDTQRAELLGDAHDPRRLQDWRLRWFEAAFQAANTPIERMLWVDNRTYLADVLLPKMDIAAMHCGLETRSPLLDHVVIEHCARLHVSLKVNAGTGKYLLKRLAERYYPADFVYRKKMGFAIPVATWLRGALREEAEAVLFDRDLMEPLEPSVIRAHWNKLIGVGSAPSDSEASRIWTLLMYGHWRKELKALTDRKQTASGNQI